MKKTAALKPAKFLLAATVAAALFSSLPAWADRGNDWDQRNSSHGAEARHEHEFHDARNEHDARERPEVHRGRDEHHRVPDDYRSGHHGHDVVYAHGGHFYRDGPHGFISIGIPFGAVFASLPIGHVRVVLGGIPYFYADGAYYQPYAQGGYQVVEVPSQVVPATTVTPTPVANTQAILVSVSALNVRSGPGMNFGVVGQVYQGVRLQVNGTSPGWYYIQTPDGRYGWIMTRFTAPAQAEPQG